MATVWRGTDLHHHREVAVKVLDPARLAQSVALARLYREAQAVALLDHPNIVAGHDFGIDGDSAFLVMELVDGPSLADLLTDEGPLPIGRAISIAEQACAALAAAHATGVIHRDIKPGNLIISPSGAVKVCDFGIARLQASDEVAGLTATNTVVGTCEYMAPEQATGDPLDGRADLYALGCVLYAMLAGRPPFVSDNPLAVLHQHLEELPTPLHTLRGDVPVGLARLVADLMAKSPLDRPATAIAAQQRLAAVKAEPAKSAGAGLAATWSADTAAARTTDELPRSAGLHRDPATQPRRGRRLVIPDRLRRWVSSDWLRQWWIGVVSVAAMLASVVTVAVFMGVWDADRRPAATLAPTPPTRPEPAATAPTATADTPTAAPSTTRPTGPAAGASRTGGTTPADRLAAFAALVQQQVDNGNLDPKAGRRLAQQLIEVAIKVRDGETGKAAEKLAELDDRLTELRRDDKLSPAGFTALNVLDPIIAALN